VSNLPERKDQPLSLKQQDIAIAEAKNRAVLPTLDVIAEELERRAKSGELAQEMHGLNATKLINNLTKILASIKQAAPIIVMPSQGVGDGKDPSFFRANSATNLDAKERERRRKAVEAEIVE
jgi:hypothetical protein